MVIKPSFIYFLGDIMDNIEKQLEQYKIEREERKRKQEEERKVFFKKCSNKIRDGEFIYDLLADFIAKRFNVDIKYCNTSPVYAILNYYIDNVDEDFVKWLYKDNAPYIVKASQMPVIFHEFKQLNSNKAIMEMANKMYNLNLEYSYNDDYGDDYVFAYEFDFNSFEPINLDEVIELKRDIDILKKYNHDTSELESKLNDFNLPKDILDVI